MGPLRLASLAAAAALVATTAAPAAAQQRGRPLDETHVVVTHAPRSALPAVMSLPFQSFPTLGGKAVGLLFQGAAQPWGVAYDFARQLGEDPDRDEYRFGVDGASPLAVYFPSNGHGRHAMPSFPIRGVPTPVALFSSATPNAWRLSRPAHVVALDVNGGVGSTRELIFTATGVRVLDGTPVVPMDVSAVLTALRARAERTVAPLLAQERAFLDAQAAVQRAAGATAIVDPGPRFGVFPTWREATRTLEVTFTVQVAQSATFPTRTVMSECAPCRCDGVHCPPCMPCPPPRPVDVTPRPSWGWDLSIVDVVDARGRLLTETVTAPREFP